MIPGMPPEKVAELTTDLGKLEAFLAELPPEQKKALQLEVSKATVGRVWTPNPGAQTEAYHCLAHEIGFGGEAGPGKTELLIGLSLQEHKRSLILRRTKAEARKLVDRYEEILGHRDGLNSAHGVWRLPGRVIDYGGVEHEDDKHHYKGSPHDLIGFDEVVDFSRSQYEFIIQWCRSSDPNQRCRIVATFNPPTRPVGLWVLERWGPWLNPRHPNPAKSGEIRWFTTIDGEDTEVDGPGPHLINGEEVMALSRTFIRGRLHENLDMTDANYDAVRAAAPEHLRVAYRSGDFEAALADVPGQLIPSAWVRAAQERWAEKPPSHVPMCAVGVDCSGGGRDPMVLAPRYDFWFARPIEVPGKDLPVERMGAMSAGIIVSHRRDNAQVIVDLGGGYGGPVFEKLTENGIPVKGFRGGERSTKRTRDRQYGFFNKRSEAYWHFREALDPDQPNGSPIALPPDQKLFADLTTVTFEVGPHGIQLEPKEKLIERLGRSPDFGDAVVMAYSQGETSATQWQVWKKVRETFPRVNRGHEPKRRRH